VSGGPDSLAMLALALAGGCRAHALHVDHGLRPGSDSEAAVVEAAASLLGATFSATRVSVPAGADIEARARAARYRALPEGALVGHTADDQAETLLLNLFRGCGLDGLAAMRGDGAGPRKVRRPILALRRRETAELVSALGLPVVTDPTNEEPRFRRNRVRHELIPLLESVFERDPVPLLCRTSGLVSEDADLLAALAGELDPSDVKALRSAPRVLANRALRRWIRQQEGFEQHPPSADELERAWRVVAGEVRSCELAGGRRLSRKDGRLRLETARLTGP
jgi:tRNA(Ile)-lysidine synthase